jgi:hypothetical protein
MLNFTNFARGFHRTHVAPLEAELRTPSTYMMVVLLVALAAGSRLVNIMPNFSAVAAVAMFAGFYFKSRMLAASTVVLSMLLSDMVAGGHDWRMMLVVYGALVAPVFFTPLLGQRPSLARVAGCGVLSACVFFLVTNFAVWSFGGLYSKTWAGLVECFTMALPFFRFTLLGDVSFAAATFGAFYAVERVRDARALATA